MTDPAFTKPGSVVSAPAARSSASVNGLIDSTPSRRFAQNASTFGAPGNRPAMPTMAISSRSRVSPAMAHPSRSAELALACQRIEARAAVR